MMAEKVEQKILVVDDDPGVLDLLKKTFMKEGFQVAAAESGQEALDLLQNEFFPVIFIDLKMPGMEGLEVCRRIRSTMPTPKIFAITAYPSKYEFSECIKTGFDGYFTKPFKIKVLIMTARQAFENFASESA